MTRSAGSPQHGLLPPRTKFERDWIAYEEERARARRRRPVRRGDEDGPRLRCVTPVEKIGP